MGLGQVRTDYLGVWTLSVATLVVVDLGITVNMTNRPCVGSLCMPYGFCRDAALQTMQ